MAPLLAQKRSVDRTFERLYRLHALDVYRYAYAVLRNQADAEDVAQTTFMNAYRALERGESPQSPHNWLISIAHNVCRQRFRQASRRVQEVGLDDDVADALVRPEDEDAPAPEDIRRALGHLAFNQRAALVMRELEGRSYAEIAEVLGLSVGAVETLLFRARRALREQLGASLTCGQAEQLISRQLDGRLSRADRSQLRAHLRECAECRRVARSQRAQRSALKAFGAVPLPQSLATLFGGGAAVATKAAVVVATAGVAGGIGWDVHHRLQAPPPAPPALAHTQTARTAPRHAVPVVRPAVATTLVPVRRGDTQSRPNHPVLSPTPSSRVVATPPQTVHPTHPAHPVQPPTPRRATRPQHPTHPVTPRPKHPKQQRGHGTLHGKPPTGTPLQEPHKGSAQEGAGDRHLHP